MIEPFFLIIALAIAAIQNKIGLVFVSCLVYAILLLLFLIFGKTEITVYYNLYAILLQVITLTLFAILAYIHIKLKKFW